MAQVDALYMPTDQFGLFLVVSVGPKRSDHPTNDLDDGLLEIGRPEPHEGIGVAFWIWKKR